MGEKWNKKTGKKRKSFPKVAILLLVDQIKVVKEIKIN